MVFFHHSPSLYAKLTRLLLCFTEERKSNVLKTMISEGVDIVVWVNLSHWCLFNPKSTESSLLASKMMLYTHSCVSEKRSTTALSTHLISRCDTTHTHSLIINKAADTGKVVHNVDCTTFTRSALFSHMTHPLHFREIKHRVAVAWNVIDRLKRQDVKLFVN